MIEFAPSVRRLVALATATALLLGAVPWLPVAPVRAVTTVFINEIHYDNTGTDAGEFVEVAGPAGTDLTGWSIVLYNGNGGASYDTDVLSATIPDQQNGYGTVALTYPSNGIQNGSPDGIALVDPSSAVVQFLSYEGTFAAVGGPANGLTSTDIGVSQSGSDAIGLSLQLAGTGTAYEDFTWSAPADDTPGAVNVAQTFGTVLNLPVVADCGAALSTLEGTAAGRTVSATDGDGTVVDIALADVTPAAPGITLGATTPAAGDGGTATAELDVAATVAPGSYTVTLLASNDDATPQEDDCTLAVTVQALRSIGEVQGAVDDGANGLTHRSAFAPASGNSAGQTVYVTGVVTQRGRFPTSSGGQNYGFWLQSRIGSEDGDPTSSDGIFVFIGSFATVLREDGSPPAYFPVVGDEIVLRGNVSEFFSLTQLSSPRLVEVLATGVDIGDPNEIETAAAAPPDDLADANRFWERREGMRFHLDAGALVVAARDVFASTRDGELWVIRGDHPLATRSDPFTRLVYRDTHPLDDVGPAGSFDNGNGMRIMLQSHGLKWLAASNAEIIAPARTYDTVENALTGALYFAFSKYGIEIEQQLELTPGADPAANAPPSAAVAGIEFATSDYNVENLYDYRDDPFDGCDFAGNAGCPGVNPPFDYVPSSEAAYQQHLGDLAAQIAGPMHAPDLLMIQEAEDQDICTVAGGALVCDDVDNADGKPDTLQELALAIVAAGGPTYDAAYDRDGADDRGIVSAFLYRTDRVELLPADAADPILGSSPTIDYPGGLAYNADVSNPKALNAELPAGIALGDACDEPGGRCVFTRDPQVGLFRVWRDGIGTSVFTDLYAVSNHFSSTPDARVPQRTEQARYNAKIAEAIAAADPAARIVNAGDFNVYPRPDDPFAPGHPSYPSDQLGPMYDAGLLNLWDDLVADVPASAYSYSFNGQAQTLDTQWANPVQHDDLVAVRVAHLNADFPADHDGDVARGASDHDPQLARWSTEVTIPRLHDLVDYYLDLGALPEHRAAALHRSLDRAAAWRDAGRTAAYRIQLLAFGLQAFGRGIDPDVSRSLLREATRLALMR